MEIHWIIPYWAMCIFYIFIGLSIIQKIIDIYHSHLDKKVHREESKAVLEMHKEREQKNK